MPYVWPVCVYCGERIDYADDMWMWLAVDKSYSEPVPNATHCIDDHAHAAHFENFGRERA